MHNLKQSLSIAILVTLLLMNCIGKSLQLSPTNEELVAIGGGKAWLSFSQSFPIKRLPLVDILAALLVTDPLSYPHLISQTMVQDLHRSLLISYNIIGYSQFSHLFYQIGYEAIFIDDLPQQYTLLLARMPSILAACFSVLLLFCLLQTVPRKSNLSSKQNNVLSSYITFIYTIILIQYYQPLISPNILIISFLLLSWLILPKWLENYNSAHNFLVDLAFGLCTGLCFLTAGMIGFILLMILISGLIIIKDIQEGQRLSGYNFMRLARVSLVSLITFLVMWAGYKFNLAKPANVPFLSNFTQSQAPIIPLAEAWQMLLDSAIFVGRDNTMCFIEASPAECSIWYIRLVSILCQAPIFLISCIILFKILIWLRPPHNTRLQEIEAFVLYQTIGAILLIVILFYQSDHESAIYDITMILFYLVLSLSLGYLFFVVNQATSYLSLLPTFLMLAGILGNSSNDSILTSTNALAPYLRIWNDNFDRGQYMLIIRDKISKSSQLERYSDSSYLYYNISTIKPEKLGFLNSRNRDEIIINLNLCKEIIDPNLRSENSAFKIIVASNIFADLCKGYSFNDHSLSIKSDQQNHLVKNGAFTYNFLNLYQIFYPNNVIHSSSSH